MVKDLEQTTTFSMGMGFNPPNIILLEPYIKIPAWPSIIALAGLISLIRDLTGALTHTTSLNMGLRLANKPFYFKK